MALCVVRTFLSPLSRAAIERLAYVLRTMYDCAKIAKAADTGKLAKNTNLKDY